MKLGGFRGWPIGFALLMLVMASVATSLFVQPETFLELASFREISASGRFLMQDSLAYTPTHSQSLAPNWGVGAILYCFMVVSGWGSAGLLVLNYLLSFGISIACHGLSVRQGVGLPIFGLFAVLALAIATAIGVNEFQVPLFSGAALVGLYHLLWADRNRGGYWLWGCVPLMGLWSNLHEGAILGLIILAAYCFTRAAQQYRSASSRNCATERDLYLWLVLLAASFAILLNPNGWKLVTYFFALASNHSAWGFDYRPLSQSQSILAQVLFLTSIVVAAYGVHRSKPWPAFESLVLLLSCGFAINHPQFAVMYLVSWICLVPPLIDPTRVGQAIQDGSIRHSFQVASISIAVGLVGLGFAIQNRFWEFRMNGQPTAESKNESIYPIAATDFLASKGFTGNLLVPEQAGGYVAWRLFPQVKISSDSRLHLAYPKQAVQANRNFFRAVEGWPGLIGESTDALLIPIQEPVFQALNLAIQERRFNWQPVYRDQGYAIFVRSGVEVADLSSDSNLNLTNEPDRTSKTQVGY